MFMEILTGRGGILSYLQDILGGFCPRQQKRVGGFCPGGILSYTRAKLNVISDVLRDGEGGVRKTITNC